MSKVKKNDKRKTKSPMRKRKKSPSLTKHHAEKKISRNGEKYIYFDNNGTTLICPQAERAMTKWMKCYNASSDYRAAASVKKMLEAAEKQIHEHCNTGGPDNYIVLFTSGGTESNCTIIRMITESYYSNFFETPHIITSSMEHHSILQCLHDLEENKRVEVTYIKPTIHGVIVPNTVKNAIKDNTCLVSIMYANNELGTINNIPEISKIVHESSGSKFRIPFHTDAVQLFGKHRIKMMNGKKSSNDIDALSMSFHKLYGPKGLGLLIIKKDLVNGFGLNAIMAGSQQNGLRGGTENVPCIAGSMEALKYTFKNRVEKNKHLMKLKKLFLELMAKRYKFSDYRDYIDYPSDKDRDVIELVLLGPPNHEKKVLPNTILLSVVKNKGKPFCNIKFKKKLSKEGIAISIGSACLTGDAKSSHVIESINAPDIIKRGVFRISFGDANTETEVRKFVRIFNSLLKEERKK